MSFLHPVVCDRLRRRMRTGMAMEFMRMFMRMNSPEARAGIRRPDQYKRLARSRVGVRVRLEKGLQL